MKRFAFSVSSMVPYNCLLEVRRMFHVSMAARGRASRVFARRLDRKGSP